MAAALGLVDYGASSESEDGSELGDNDEKVDTLKYGDNDALTFCDNGGKDYAPKFGGNDGKADASQFGDNDGKADASKGVDFITGTMDGNSSESDTGRGSDEVDKDKLPNPLAGSVHLPKPKFKKKKKLNLKDKNIDVSGSIYENPFQNAEKAKMSILEKHVKMTANDQEVIEANSKKICWNYQKGKCRLGRKCKFLHPGSDVEGAKTNDTPSEPAIENNYGAKIISERYGNKSRQDNFKPVDDDDDSYMGQMAKKRRFGTTDGLAPPRKAMEKLVEMRAKERPWTMNE